MTSTRRPRSGSSASAWRTRSAWSRAETSSRRARSRDSPAADQDICGLGFYQKESLDEVRPLIEQDPGVQQGLYCFDLMTWRTAPGTVAPPTAAWVRG